MRHRDRAFLDFVQQNRSVGYGRMMQIVSHEWYRDFRRTGGPVSGVLIVNACLGSLPPDEQEEFMRMAESEDGQEGEQG